MPITPQFEISQTDELVQLDIHVPHVRVSSDSLHVVLSDDNQCLHFASPPYLLILTFQHAFQENAEDFCAQYDPLREHGRVVLKLAKQQAGIYWDDLDMVGALMKPRSNLNQFIKTEYQNQTPQKSTWIKEVLEETTTVTEEEDNDKTPQEINNLQSQNGYGFARMFHGIFTDLARDGLAREMLEVPLDERGSILNVLGDDNINDDNAQKKTRLAMECSKFESERYLQDLDIYDDYLYQTAMQMQPHWRTELPSTTTQGDNDNSFFTSQESAQLASIPYPLLPPVLKERDQNLWLGVLDLLFAYCYDHLLTDGDPTVESAWTISILSCSLSWLESFDNGESVIDVVSQSIRRSLIYPYLRNVDFAIFIWEQVSQIVRKGGRRGVIRCLLQIRTILDQSELYYLGNKLYTDPYLAWLQDSQRHDDENLQVISNHIDNILRDSKELHERIGLNLSAIEREAFGEDGDEDEVASTSSGDSESSDDSDEDESSCASEENDKNDGGGVSASGATTNHCLDGVETLNTTETSTGSALTTTMPVETHSHELLDEHLNGTGVAPQPRSLIVDMAQLSIKSHEDDGKSSKDVAPTKLIEELN